MISKYLYYLVSYDTMTYSNYWPHYPDEGPKFDDIPKITELIKETVRTWT